MDGANDAKAAVIPTANWGKTITKGVLTYRNYQFYDPKNTYPAALQNLTAPVLPALQSTVKQRSMYQILISTLERATFVAWIVLNHALPNPNIWMGFEDGSVASKLWKNLWHRQYMFIWLPEKHVPNKPQTEAWAYSPSPTSSLPRFLTVGE
ncbi:hypothetical protein MPH_00898 [Macrophomina phaseolina MS6]|uniref:Uncharacterized protein n=1 Tax=Macrophomina phaseolina (strain MS6) TaxID=1126212 RepID=K2SYS7_MACPH|nr:hypothetical protein MPH_00898 [Macrophomina phaseolina MS6]